MIAIAVEIATAYVSLVASAKGIAASIATELGAPAEKAGKDAGNRAAEAFSRSFTRAATAAGQEAGEGIESALKRTAGGVDVAAPVIGKPIVPEPDTEKLDASVVAAAKRAAEKATRELSAIPGGIDAATFEAKVNAAATAAANQAKARLANIPVTLDIGKIGAQAASAAKIEPPEIPPPDDSKFISGAKKAGLAAGAAIGAGLAVGFAVAAGNEVSNDKLAGQLGINDPAFAKDLGKVAGKVYGNAFGESIGEVNAGIRAVLQNGLVPEDATNAAIQSVTEKVLGLASTFEQDLGGTASAVGQLMKTGMAKDATEALDLITRGFQQGVDRRGDFLDTITEYGTQFRKLGIDGPKAIGLLSQGLRGGARDADIVADSIKEFSIRAIAVGDPNTTRGFSLLGLSAEKMAAQIGRGGEAASAALDLTLDRLRAMPDPVQRAQAAVALFGTQAEDLGDALFELDPSAAVEGLGDIAGAADRMNAVVGDNASTAFESFKRNALGALGGVAGAFGPVLDLAPALGGLALTASTVGPHLASAAGGIASAAKSGASFVANAGPMPGILAATSTSGTSAGKALLGVAGTAVGLFAVVTVLGEIGGKASDVSVDLGRLAKTSEKDLVGAFRKLITFTGDLGAADDAFTGVLKTSVSEAQRLVKALDAAGLETGRYTALIGEEIASQKAAAAAKEEDAKITGEVEVATIGAGSAIDSMTGAVGDQGSAFDDTSASIEDYDDAMNRLIGVHVSAERAAIDYAAAHHDLAASVQENGRSLDLATVGGRANREAILGLITATTDHVEAMRNEGATADQMNATFATHRAELARVLGQLGLNKEESAKYLGLLDQVPASVFTKAEVDTKDATRTLTEWQALIARTAKAFDTTFGRPGIGAGLAGREHGGRVQVGQPYVVGERRPELFVPDTNGTIIPSVPSGAGGFSVGGISVTSRRDEEIATDVTRSLRSLAYLIGA